MNPVIGKSEAFTMQTIVAVTGRVPRMTQVAGCGFCSLFHPISQISQKASIGITLCENLRNRGTERLRYLPQNYIVCKEQHLYNYRMQTGQLNKAKNLIRVIHINQHSSIRCDVKTNKQANIKWKWMCIKEKELLPIQTFLTLSV